MYNQKNPKKIQIFINISHARHIFTTTIYNKENNFITYLTTSSPQISVSNLLSIYSLRESQYLNDTFGTRKVLVIGINFF